MPDFNEGQPRRTYLKKRESRPPPTLNLENHPSLVDIFGTNTIVFPRERNPKGKSFQDLRMNLAQYWVDGGLAFVHRFESPQRGKRLREEIDWEENDFQLKLREFAEIMGFSRRFLKKTRQALLVGRLVEKDLGIWLFTKEELLQLAVGAHAYLLIQRRYSGKKH